MEGYDVDLSSIINGATMYKMKNENLGNRLNTFVTHFPICSNLGHNLPFLETTRHVFEKHGCPRRQQSQNMAKISKSYIMTSPHPRGHGMSVKCEEPLDELTVQVWLLYLHLNFNYWTLSVSGTELRTDKRTDGRTDRRSDY